MKYCSKCGTQLSDDALFCDNCGNNLGNDDINDNSRDTDKDATAGRKRQIKIAILAVAVIAGALIAFGVFKHVSRYPSKIEGVYAAESDDGAFYNILNFKKDGTVTYTSEYKERTEQTHDLFNLVGEERTTGTYKTQKKHLTLILDLSTSVYDYQMTDSGLELIGQDGTMTIYTDVTDSTLGQQEVEYAEAEKLYADGKYNEAMSVYESLNYYYDSAEKIRACLQVLLVEDVKNISAEAINLEKTDYDRFRLTLKYTNNSLRSVDDVNISIEILDNEGKVMANFDEVEMTLDLEKGASKENSLKLTIPNINMADRIAKAQVGDIRLVLTLNNVTYEGVDTITCEDEVRDITLQNKSLEGWQQIDGKWYYYDEYEGMKHDCWFFEDGENASYYYFGSDGAMLTSTTTPDGVEVDADGRCVAKELEGTWNSASGRTDGYSFRKVDDNTYEVGGYSGNATSDTVLRGVGIWDEDTGIITCTVSEHEEGYDENGAEYSIVDSKVFRLMFKEGSLFEEQNGGSYEKLGLLWVPDGVYMYLDDYYMQF